MSLFQDVSDHVHSEPDLWPPVTITGEEIDAEIERFSQRPGSASGRRESLIVHPRHEGAGPGLASSIQVKLCVLNPGERTKPIRHNSTQVNFCIRGAGFAVVDGQRIDFSQYDVWNYPGYSTYFVENNTADVQVRLTYSNAALLEKLNTHLVDENPPEIAGPSMAAGEQTTPDHPIPTFPINDAGAQLMPYETLINPPNVTSKALHWPWKRVEEELEGFTKLGPDYVGRRLFLLYNPMTGRTNGTTPSFFATITIRPPGIVDRPHRHVSAAINYYMSGKGYSRVGGKKYYWKGGDLMLSAPGWAIHNHASGDERVYELTVQDQPLNINMESLLWQEDLKIDAYVLGKERGFNTNRSDLTD